MTRPSARATMRAILTSTALVAAATMAAPTPASAAPTALTVVTANLDFGLSQAQVKQDWPTISKDADVVFVQEAKNVDLAAIVDTSVWAVRQSTASEAEQGSGLVVRKSSFSGAIGDLHLRLGTAGGSCPDGGILARYIAWAEVTLKNGTNVRLASLHMPPARCQTGPGSLYDDMAEETKAFAQDTGKKLVIGADWNKVVDDDPNGIAQASGMTPYGPNSGTRIDGFMADNVISGSDLHHLANTNSDHDPVQMNLDIP